MAPITPAEARTMVVAVLKRALHGPTGLEDTQWPGNTRTPIVVHRDQVFPDWNSLNEALVDDQGQEVLRTSPTRVYGIGALYPQMTQDEEEEITVDQDLSQHSDDDHTIPAAVIPDPEESAGAAEETVQVPDGGNRPRSIALTIHIPVDSEQANITITGACYRRLPVFIAGSANDFWQRVPISQVVTFRTDQNRQLRINPEGISLTIGVDSRRSLEGHFVTVYLANMSESAGDVPAHCLFQAQIKVESEHLLQYPAALAGANSEDATFDLLYRKHLVKAIGHGTDAVVHLTDQGFLIQTETMPSVELSAITPDVTADDGSNYGIGMRDLAQMNAAAVVGIERLIVDYGAWIAGKTNEAEHLEDSRIRAEAERHLMGCRNFLADIREGWILVQAKPDVAQCLSWTSKAMDDQRRATTASLRETALHKSRDKRTTTVEGANPHSLPKAVQAVWRPFQIAFILASLPPAIDPAHPGNQRVDIIWMPTGGGKTEAYLGLAAFTMLWQRRLRVASGSPIPATVDVLMRYTLRLLTAQQVQRAAALICAIEVLRLAVPELLGKRPFRIGAYLGQRSTPNNRKDAVMLWNNLDSNPKGERGDRGFLLTRCPWCGAQMGVVAGGIAGYRKVPTTNGVMRVVAFCPASDCPFAYAGNPSESVGLPVLEVDEDIYIAPPAFLVGTIDKFAQLSWKPKARALFGLAAKDGQIVRRAEPPALLIQDELHLIAGPLGSLDALYEVTIEQLCEFDGGRKPRIIAATATTKEFDKQVLRLYGRSQVRLVPPPALDVDDSFFSRVDHSKPGKVFVAVCAPGYGSNVQAQLRVIAALLHAGGTLDVAEAHTDPWWTNLVFFSSRRSLGLQLSACQTGLDRAAFALSGLSGLRVGRVTEKGRKARRSIGQVKELTATSRDNVTELLAQLNVEKGKGNCIDLCFATSMIEVGVDVPRLGLMTVMGQPKSYSQYIQVTGRVGRSDQGPGVVVVVLSPHNVRDRSHYETFTASHHRLYAGVEPVSITPFTPQALERGLAGALTGVMRSLTDHLYPIPLLNDECIRTALDPWERRAKAIGDVRATVTLEEETSRLLRLARAAVVPGVQLDWDGYQHNARNPFLLALGDQNDLTVQNRWRVPLSMRSVDSEAGVIIPKGVGMRPSNAPSPSGDMGEDF